MARRCFICGASVAPFGYGLPGTFRDKPTGKRGYVWVCADHRQDAERRREAAIAALYGRSVEPIDPFPTAETEKGHSR